MRIKLILSITEKVCRDDWINTTHFFGSTFQTANQKELNEKTKLFCISLHSIIEPWTQVIFSGSLVEGGKFDHVQQFAFIALLLFVNK